jgi:hypothetical protein
MFLSSYYDGEVGPSSSIVPVIVSLCTLAAVHGAVDAQQADY